MPQPCEEQAASSSPTVRSFHILQQESPEEKAGVKSSILQWHKTLLEPVPTHPAQPARSLAFQRAVSLLNAVLCPVCPVSDSSSGAAAH